MEEYDTPTYEDGVVEDTVRENEVLQEAPLPEAYLPAQGAIGGDIEIDKFIPLALTGGRGTSVTPAPTPTAADKPGLKKWIKKQLNSLANVLKGLAIYWHYWLNVSWLLKSAAKVAGWTA